MLSGILLPLESWSFGVVGQPLTLILPTSLNFLSLAASAPARPSSNSGHLLAKLSNLQESGAYIFKIIKTYDIIASYE